MTWILYATAARLWQKYSKYSPFSNAYKFQVVAFPHLATNLIMRIIRGNMGSSSPAIAHSIPATSAGAPAIASAFPCRLPSAELLSAPIVVARAAEMPTFRMKMHRREPEPESQEDATLLGRAAQQLQAYTAPIEGGVRSVLGDFQDFIQQGNMVDLAVGLILGSSFSAVLNSFVLDILSPVISLFTGKGIVLVGMATKTDKVTFALQTGAWPTTLRSRDARAPRPSARARLGRHGSKVRCENAPAVGWNYRLTRGTGSSGCGGSDRQLRALPREHCQLPHQRALPLLRRQER